MNEEIIQNKVYVHYKGGEYLVLFLANESTNERAGGNVVVYVSLTYGKIKCRDYKEFVEIIKWSDGSKKSRFILKE